MFDMIGSLISGVISTVTVAGYVGAIVSAVKFITWDKSEDPVIDTGIFDQVVAQFQGICLGAYDNGQGLMHNSLIYAAGLFHYLILFDFIIAVIMGLLAFESGPNFITLFANKIFKYGFWTWIMLNWQKFTTQIVNSFEKIGNFSGSAAFISNKPSMIADLGWTYAGSYLKIAFVSMGEKKEIDTVFIAVVTLLVALIIFLSFFVMAINLVVTKVEYFISVSLMLIFIPFALFDKTERFASQVFNLVISCGVRLMVLSALCSIAFAFYDPKSTSGAAIKAIYTYKDQPGIINALMAMAISAMFGYLCCEIPQVASGIISGALQLNSNSAFLHAAGASAAIQSSVGIASKGVGTLAGAAQRASDAASSGAGVMGTIGAFSKGISSGLAKGTMGGLEEGQAVFRAASGRSSELETVGENGKPADNKSSVTRDSNGNVVGASNGASSFMQMIKDKLGSGAGGNSSGGSNGDNGYQGPPKNSMSTASGATKGGTGNFNKPMS